MKVPKKYYDEIFNFKGQWEMPSKCGLKIIKKDSQIYIIVTELYQDNPGTSITYAGKLLKKQICEAKNIDIDNIVYIECNPDTNSVLSFYDEEFFEVTFNDTKHATYRKLSLEEIKNIFDYL